MQSIFSSLIRIFAAYGISQLIGVPVVGNVLATLLQGTSDVLETAAEYIRYDNAEEFNADALRRLQAGAGISKSTQYDDGAVGVTYDTTNFDVSAYTNEEIPAEAYTQIQENWI